MLKFYEARKNLLLLLLLLVGTSAWAQEVRVSGRVTSADDGSPLPGVNIAEKGTSNGTITDANGNYGLSVKSGSTLIFSFVGYSSQEVEVGARTSIDIVLQTDILALSEIVVVGYGQQEKKDVTGAVIDISTRDFNRGVIASPQDLLVGKLAGVSVTSQSGAPGSNSTIRIRGGASLNASNDPLIVIDGFPVDNSTLSGVANPLATINPNDIENVTVLKDASATAIYGSRASNGVIIITTKKGKSGKPQFNFNSTLSFSSPIKYMDVLTGDEYRTLVTELAQRGVSGINQAALDNLGTENTDWQKEIFRTAISTDQNLSASGSIKNIPFRVSYGYTNQQGILKNTDMVRNSLNVNLTPSFFDNRLKLTVNAKASNVVNNFGEQGAVGNAITFDPTKPIYDEGNNYGGYYSWLTDGATNATTNPVAQINLTDNVGTSNRLIGNVQADYNLPFLPELRLTLNLGMDYAVSDGYNRAPEFAEFTKIASSTVTVGRDNSYSGSNKSRLLDLYANYSKKIGIHKFDVTAGHGYQFFTREAVSTDRRGDGSIIGETDDPNQNALLSFFGRANYSLNDKYLLTATFRADGSSKFLNAWGYFPSLSAAWRIKDEAFLSSVAFISDLKLRAGYGETGQQDIRNNYPALALYTGSTPTARYEFGGEPFTTLRPNPYDANISWETSSTYNLGIDFGLFESKLTGSVELYDRETTGLLSNIQVASGTNFSNFVDTNIGSTASRGIELSLQATPIASESFTWNVGFNFTRNVNEITKLLLVPDPSYLGITTVGNIGVDQFIQNHQVGYAPSSFFVYQQVYGDDGYPIEGLYVDRSGNGGTVVGNNFNKYRYQKPVPDFTMGLNSRADYKNWDFSFSSRVSIGNYVYNNNVAGRAFYNNVYNLGFFSNVPRAIEETRFVSQRQLSDYYVQNASFFKLDNMSVGYSFNNLMSGKLKARVSVTGQNLFIVTKYKGIDPEVDGGIDNNIYPRPRVILLGVNVEF